MKKLPKLKTAGITDRNAEETFRDIIISQQVEYIQGHGCSGLQCRNCCLKYRCNHTPAHGRTIACALYAHAMQRRGSNA